MFPKFSIVLITCLALNTVPLRAKTVLDCESTRQTLNGSDFETCFISSLFGAKDAKHIASDELGLVQNLGKAWLSFDEATKDNVKAAYRSGVSARDAVIRFTMPGSLEAIRLGHADALERGIREMRFHMFSDLKLVDEMSSKQIMQYANNTFLEFIQEPKGDRASHTLTTLFRYAPDFSAYVLSNKDEFPLAAKLRSIASSAASGQQLITPPDELLGKPSWTSPLKPNMGD